MRRIGRTLVAVVLKVKKHLLPGRLDASRCRRSPEIFSPMVYPVADELFSAYLSEAVGEPPFRAFSGEYERRASRSATAR